MLSRRAALSGNTVLWLPPSFLGGGFFQLATPKATAPILTLNTPKDVVSRKNVPLGDPENNILHFDPIFAKNGNFRSIYDGTENFGWKRALTWGNRK